MLHRTRTELDLVFHVFDHSDLVAVILSLHVAYGTRFRRRSTRCDGEVDPDAVVGDPGAGIKASGGAGAGREDG
jgi:hypothetical protein